MAITGKYKSILIRTVKSKISFLLIFIAVFSNCVRNHWIVDDERNSGLIDEYATKYIIYFNSKVESTFTRAVTEFPSGCNVKIFAFIAGDGYQSIVSPVYESKTAGALSPTQSPMYLPVGTYDFYAVSLETDSLPPTFLDNTASVLKNNTDYLWCGVTNKVISVSGDVIDLTFTHCASQMVFKIVNEGTEYGFKSISEAYIGLPDSTGATWDLTSGIISQLSDPDMKIKEIDYDDLTLKTIFLPYTSTSNNNLAIIGISQTGTYLGVTVDVPVPTDGFESGKSYNFEILFRADTFLLGDVVVAPWTEDDMGNLDITVQ